MDDPHFNDECPSFEAPSYSGGRATAVERARVLFDHVCAGSFQDYDQVISDKASNQSDLSCFNEYDKSKENEISCAATDGQSKSIESTESKKASNWLDVLKIDPKMYWPKKYRYTIEPRPGSTYALSIRQREFYEENGYLVLHNVLAKSIISKLETSNLGKSWTHQSPSVNHAISSEILKNFVASPQMLRLIECFCGPNIMAMSCSEVFDTQFRTSRESDFRRDLHCMPFRPADRIVCIWAPIKSFDSGLEPGLNVIPGSHKTSYLESIYSDEDGNTNQLFYERIHDINTLIEQRQGESSPIFPIAIKPGDLLLYHPLLAYSVQLRELNRLMAINARYASSECQYVFTQAKRNFFAEISPVFSSTVSVDQDRLVVNKDIWQNEGIVVKGKRINL